MAFVEFSHSEWNDFLLAQGVQHSDDPPPLWDAMQSARGAEVGKTLERANRLVDGHGVEAIHAEGQPYGEIVATYVNFGDPYVQTLLYDTEADTFYLTSYGDWLEGWEAEHPTEEEEEEEERVDSWRPGGYWGDPPMIATLRSVEGDEIAVHLWGAGDNPVLAFSIAFRDGSFSSRQIVSRDRQNVEPYTYRLTELIEHFRRSDAMSVAFTTRDVTLNREQFNRLQVALDGFFERGNVALPAFLKPPPVLWTCEQVNHIVWYEERGEATVDAFVAEFDNRGRAHHELSVWSAHSPDVEELIEGGFIKWGKDATVREYLGLIGVCRRS